MDKDKNIFICEPIQKMYIFANEKYYRKDGTN